MTEIHTITFWLLCFFSFFGVVFWAVIITALIGCAQGYGRGL